MQSAKVLRRSRRSSVKALQTQLALLSDIYEKDCDSGLDESSEEEIQEISDSRVVLTDEEVTMKTYDSEVDKNITLLEEEIIRCCDQLIISVERRKNELLSYVKEIRAEKLQTLQDCYDTRLNNDRNIFSKIDNLGSCLRFVADDKLLNLISEYGSIDEGRAAPEKSVVVGIGLQYGIADEPTQIELETYNKLGELSWVEQDKIDIVIKRENQIYPCVVQNKCNGVYNIFYELQDPGQYEIHVQVNGRHIKNSPFLCEIFEKCELKFLKTDNKPEWVFQNGEKSALVEKTEIQRTSKLYSNILPPAKAWKVRVTTACPKIKIKFGYSDTTTGIPDLYDEYYCKFNLSELITSQLQLPHHHTYQHHRRHSSKKTHERKQSTFHRSSLTFVIFQDSVSNVIHVAVEGTEHHKKTVYQQSTETLVPFIGIKHFCKNVNCPRPMLVFS